MALQFLGFRKIIFRVRFDVWNLDRTALQQGTAHRGSPPCSNWGALPEFQGPSWGVVRSSRVAALAIVAENHAVLRTANAHGILQQRRKDALKIKHRPADGLEHLCRRSLFRSASLSSSVRACTSSNSRTF